MTQTATVLAATHIVTYKGVERECNETTYVETCDALVRELGAALGEYPVVRPIEGARLPVSDDAPKSAPRTAPGQIDQAGKLRSLRDEDLATASGFAPAPPVYSVGTRVLQLGVDNARAMQVEHDAKPPAKEVAESLVRIVREEERHDLPPVRVSELRMTSTGLLALPAGEPGRGPRFPISERSFGSLMGRMPCRSGIAYLNDCTTKLRAINFNHWADHLHAVEANAESPSEAVLRTRKTQGTRQVFAAVSPSYTPFDADKIGEALALALPADARGSLDYDGQRMRLEALWRSDVAPEEFVAGEFFKAGVIVRADDTGAGSIRVQSVLWRNLCLNLIILDKAIGVDIRLRHVGSVEALAERFRVAFREALSSVEGFRRAWGSAMTEKEQALVQRSAGTTSDDIVGLPASAVLSGLFNGILESELVVVRGRKTDVVPKLLEMHSQDEAADAYGVSRASVVNAFTRYAHRVESDPFAADLIREGAGKLLSGYHGRPPAPLPYVAFGG